MSEAIAEPERRGEEPVFEPGHIPVNPEWKKVRVEGKDQI